jgi:hypothetical protein
MVPFVAVGAGALLSIAACSGGAAGGGGTTGGNGGNGGAAGGQSANVDYRVCVTLDSLTSATVYRVDRSAMTCTFMLFTQDAASSPSGAFSGDWHLMTAEISGDVAACDAQQMPSNAVVASSASGTFMLGAVDPGMDMLLARDAAPPPGGVAIPVADLDVTLTFPASADFPPAEHAVATGCFVSCLPASVPNACGT